MPIPPITAAFFHRRSRAIGSSDTSAGEGAARREGFSPRKASGAGSARAEAGRNRSAAAKILPAAVPILPPSGRRPDNPYSGIVPRPDADGTLPPEADSGV